jgi:hypothetical protein
MYSIYCDSIHIISLNSFKTNRVNINQKEREIVLKRGNWESNAQVLKFSFVSILVKKAGIKSRVFIRVVSED